MSISEESEELDDLLANMDLGEEFRTISRNVSSLALG